MLTQAMQDGADHINQTLLELRTAIDTLIQQGGGTGDGATENEVLSLLSPIASTAQQLLDTVNAAIGQPPPAPAAFAARRTGPTGRGPVRRS